MDFIDYREALGLSFFDKDKLDYLIIQMFNILDGLIESNVSVSFNEYFDYCNDCGEKANPYYMGEYKGQERFKHCVQIISDHRKNIKEFLLYYVWFANSINADKKESWSREDFIVLLEKALKRSHVQYEVLEDEGKYFVFPKGAEELDSALVSEPLKWLLEYPNARKTYIIALNQYSEGIYIRDVADNLRKTLETFLQEFLGNSKNLESNKNEICKYLGNKGIDAGISGLFQPLINAYKNINDRIAKHNDAVDKNILEFLLYQTGVLIRMVIVVKKADSDDKT